MRIFYSADEAGTILYFVSFARLIACDDGLVPGLSPASICLRYQINLLRAQLRRIIIDSFTERAKRADLRI
ncbi:MAG TPA: hypothetical protein DEP25_01670 [Candidatus Taylorbacteria bacterium]|nr:hypothetical protein [Candidatus Taylorbacteria bacterium]